MLALPVLLYQAYAFLVPALEPRQRRLASLLVLMVPTLFVAGAVFCYLVVLPPALHFLLNFNASEFNTQLRASDYYSFATLTMAAMGLGFQVPIGVLVLTRLGVVSVDQLRSSRRYAVVAIAVLAALLPTLDPLTLVLEMVPMLILYEGGIQLRTAHRAPRGRRRERRRHRLALGAVAQAVERDPEDVLVLARVAGGILPIPTTIWMTSAMVTSGARRPPPERASSSGSPASKSEARQAWKSEASWSR